MSTVNVMLRVRPGKREEFLQTVKSLQKDLNLDKDLTKSSFYEDVNDSSVFYLIEEWATQEFMERYMRSEQFSIFMGVLKVLCTESEIKYQLGTGKLGAKLAEA